MKFNPLIFIIQIILILGVIILWEREIAPAGEYAFIPIILMFFSIGVITFGINPYKEDKWQKNKN